MDLALLSLSIKVFEFEFEFNGRAIIGIFNLSTDVDACECTLGLNQVKYPNNYSPIVWTHENTEHTDRNGNALFKIAVVAFKDLFKM